MGQAKRIALLFVCENIRKADTFLGKFKISTCSAVLSLTAEQMRRRGRRFGCPTNASLYSCALGGAVKASVGVGSALFPNIFRLQR